MYRRKFVKLFDALKERVEKEGKKSPEWFLGFVEGFGNQKLTGYQIGALYYLLVLPGEVKAEQEEEQAKAVHGEESKISIPGIL